MASHTLNFPKPIRNACCQSGSASEVLVDSHKIGSRRLQYYRCRSHFRRIGVEPCEGKAVRADVLSERVWEHCASFIRNPAAVLEEVRQTMLASQLDQNDLNNRIASLASI